MQISQVLQALGQFASGFAPASRTVRPLEIDFDTADDVHTLSHLYESLLAKLGREGLCVLISESDDTHSADLVDALFRIERGSVTAG